MCYRNLHADLDSILQITGARITSVGGYLFQAFTFTKVLRITQEFTDTRAQIKLS